MSPKCQPMLQLFICQIYKSFRHGAWRGSSQFLFTCLICFTLSTHWLPLFLVADAFYALTAPILGCWRFLRTDCPYSWLLTLSTHWLPLFLVADAFYALTAPILGCWRNTGTASSVIQHLNMRYYRLCARCFEGRFSEGAFVSRGFCPGGISQGGFCPEGLLPRGAFASRGFCLEGH